MMLYQSVQYHAYHATFVQRRSHAAFEAKRASSWRSWFLAQKSLHGWHGHAACKNSQWKNSLSAIAAYKECRPPAPALLQILSHCFPAQAVLRPSPSPEKALISPSTNYIISETAKTAFNNSTSYFVSHPLESNPSARESDCNCRLAACPAVGMSSFSL